MSNTSGDSHWIKTKKHLENRMSLVFLMEMIPVEWGLGTEARLWLKDEQGEEMAGRINIGNFIEVLEGGETRDLEERAREDLKNFCLFVSSLRSLLFTPLSLTNHCSAP